MINNTNESQDDDPMMDRNSHHSETTTSIISSTIPNVTTATTQHDDNPQEQSDINSTNETEAKRRRSIQEIMTNPVLTNDQRRKSIQILMDSRRRSSFGRTFDEAAKNVVAEFASLAAAIDDHECDYDEDKVYCNSSSSNNNEQQQQSMNEMTFKNDNNNNDEEDFDREKEKMIELTPPTPPRHQKQQQRLKPRNILPSSSLLFNQIQNPTNTNFNLLPSSPLGSSIADNEIITVAYTLTGLPCGNPRYLEEQRPKCTHYNRNCSMISPCCGVVFGCRLCHDECEKQGIPFMKLNQSKHRQQQQQQQQEIENKARANEEQSGKYNVEEIQLSSSFSQLQQKQETQSRPLKSMRSISSFSESGDDAHHDIDRYAVEEVICRKCFTRQSSKTNYCINCKIQFGKYHCDICNLWMDDDDEPFHCDDCKICRVGGKDNFSHCSKCGMCIDKTVFHNHSCQEGKYTSKCPVCYEDIFSSRSECHELPCGHTIHWQCYCDLSSHDIRCPICKKTMLDNEDKILFWKDMRADIEEQPVPPEISRVVDVFCNDCEQTGYNHRWHPLGNACFSCGGFNTTIDVRMVGIDAFNFLNQLEGGINNG